MTPAFVALLVAIAAVGIYLGANGSITNLAGGFTAALMGNLNASEIAPYAQNAGFQGTDLATAVAVALAESSGNPSAIGDQALAPTNGPAIGLWQINSAKHTQWTQQQLLDPQTNANAAYSIYAAAGYSFSPWTTYNDGSYNSYLNDAETAVNA
jgi:Lysozyme like domain